MNPFGNDFEIDNRILYANNLCRASMPRLENGAYIDHGDDEDKPGNKQYSYFDRSGKIAFTLPDDIYWAGHFSDGLAPVLDNKRKLGFIDTSGKLVIQCKYELAVAGAYPMPYVVIPEFRNGFAYLKAFKGYIDQNGKEYFSGKRLEDKYDFSH
jgi:KWG Leptospira.